MQNIMCVCVTNIIDTKVSTGSAQVEQKKQTTRDVCTLHQRASTTASGQKFHSIMILPQVHLRKPCYDFYFL